MRIPCFLKPLAGCFALTLSAIWPGSGASAPAERAELAELRAEQLRSSERASWLPNIRRPSGVNLGGWLCLEDWFYSGPDGRHVATETKEGQGACLPPLLPHVEQPWPSEGILVNRLRKTVGDAKTAEVLEAHRHSFIEDGDLRKISELGIRLVRVPLNWAAFAHGLAPIAPSVYGEHNPANATIVVPDPFYVNTSAFVTIPNDWLKELLVRAHSHGLAVVLDLHAFPGGSADGTYNGVWPQPPVFWNSTCRVGNTSVPLQTAGFMIVEAFLRWAESLYGPARHALRGVTLMNEPAHMAAANGWDPPFAKPDQVLAWLGNATSLFMGSALPSRGVKLYMNLIDTAFPAGTFYNTTGPWWSSLLSPFQRNNQAVFDVHWYTAWSGVKGAVGDISKGVRMRCDQPIAEIRQVLKAEVQKYASDFSAHVDGLKACTEFSVGTDQDAVLACNDLDVTTSFLDAQVEVMSNYSIDSFFWSWKMPYGPTFERGWSLKVNVGMEDATRPHPCSRTKEFKDQAGVLLEGTEQRSLSSGPFFVHGPGRLVGLPHAPRELWARFVASALS